MDQQPPQPTAPSGSAPRPGVPKNLFTLDAKTIDVLKWSAIWNVAAGVIDALVAWLASAWALRGASQALGALGAYVRATPTFDIGDFVRTIIWAAIYGAIGGFVLMKFYPVFVGWQRKYLGGKLNNLFKLLFWPTVVGALIGALLLSPLGFVLGFGTVILIIVGTLVARFVYAKGMEKTIGKYFV